MFWAALTYARALQFCCRTVVVFLGQRGILRTILLWCCCLLGHVLLWLWAWPNCILHWPEPGLLSEWLEVWWEGMRCCLWLWECGWGLCSVRGDPGRAVQGKWGAGRVLGSQKVQSDLQVERAQGATAVPTRASVMGIKKKVNLKG